MKSDAETVRDYLEELPEERQDTIGAVRQVVLDNLPEGYEEAMNYGMIVWQVPLETYPDTYNGKPQMYAALASQKNYISLYLTGIYLDDNSREAFEASYKATGKRFDVGKSCVRFRTLEDLPLGVIADAIGQYEVDEFVKRVRQSRS